ncbi:SRPBCC domain-containing protein [Sphingobacterium chungjuense]|uniref:SRPBCC domain-containing protein n=1 Tax=Sphingobacterium chungjuense TaxID=2675553 RepID=UPI00140B79CE|nr:SRPBCC domain-containing protein [Sphingobacterium chungjuense]
MKKLHYNININAPSKWVADQMIGKETYPQWTTPFSPTSDFEGGWNKGDKIKFTSLDEHGTKHGILAEIVEHIPHQFISMHHYGYLHADQEITEGSELAGWENSFENYYFDEEEGVTTVRVEVTDDGEHAQHMDEIWPKALEKLKAMCER